MTTKAASVTREWPNGAWVRDTAGIPGVPGSAGEIIGFAKIGHMWGPFYLLRFATYDGFAVPASTVCYDCGAATDTSHSETCANIPQFRNQPHTPGYAA